MSTFKTPFYDQSKIISIMRELGYDANIGGICAGIAARIAQSVATKKSSERDLKTLPVIELLRWIGDDPNIVNKVRAAQAKKGDKLTEEDRRCFDLLALFESFEMMYNSSLHFAQLGKSLSHKDIEDMFFLTASKEVEDRKDQLVVIPYYEGEQSKPKLAALVKQVFLDIKNLNYDAPISILMESKRHRVLLVSDNENMVLIDPNKLPLEKLESKSAEKKIYDSLLFEDAGTLDGKKFDPEKLNVGLSIVFSDQQLRESKSVRDYVFRKISEERKQYKRLLQAVKLGQFGVIQALAENKVDLNQRSPSEETMLHFAENADIVTMLLQHKVDVNAVSTYGCSALHYAAKRGKADVVTALLSARAKIDVLDKGNSGVIYYAAVSGNYDIFKLLVDQKADVTIPNKDMKTSLHKSAKAGSLKISQELIEKYRLSINALNEFGRTPFHQAIRSGNYELVQYMLNQKADLTLIPPDTTLLELAADSGNVNVLKCLIEDCKILLDLKSDSTHTLLYRVACSDNYVANKAVDYLLSRNCDPNIKVLGLTSLGEAARSKYEGVIKLLLDAKADITLADTVGDMPFHRAIESGNKHSMNEFLEHKEIYKALDSKDYEKRTPIDVAISKKYWDIVIKILKKKPALSKDDLLILKRQNFILTEVFNTCVSLLRNQDPLTLCNELDVLSENTNAFSQLLNYKEEVKQGGGLFSFFSRRQPADTLMDKMRKYFPKETEQIKKLKVEHDRKHQHNKQSFQSLMSFVRHGPNEQFNLAMQLGLVDEAKQVISRIICTNQMLTDSISMLSKSESKYDAKNKLEIVRLLLDSNIKLTPDDYKIAQRLDKELAQNYKGYELPKIEDMMQHVEEKKMSHPTFLLNKQ